MIRKLLKISNKIKKFESYVFKFASDEFLDKYYFPYMTEIEDLFYLALTGKTSFELYNLLEKEDKERLVLTTFDDLSNNLFSSEKKIKEREKAIRKILNDIKRL